jgi:hypothetical protein
MRPKRTRIPDVEHYDACFKGFKVKIPIAGGYPKTAGEVKYYLFSTCARIFYEKFLLSKKTAFLRFKEFPLDLDPLPAASPEYQKTDDTNGGFRDHDGQKYAFWPQPKHNGQDPGQRDLKGPKTEEIHYCRGPGIPSPVKGVRKHHSNPIKDIARAYYL